MTTDSTSRGARARRGAGNEPKRKRAREDGKLPSETHAAKPPRSGRQLQVKPALAAASPMRPKELVARDPSQQPGTLKLIGGALSAGLKNPPSQQPIAPTFLF